MDCEGILLVLHVHVAQLQDRAGAIPLLRWLKTCYPTVRKLWLDSAYTGPDLQRLAQELDMELEIVRRSDDQSHGRWMEEGQSPPPKTGQFEVLPRRWVVERTLAWLGRYRRLSKDYEGLLETSAALCGWASLRLLLGRLGRADAATESA